MKGLLQPQDPFPTLTSPLSNQAEIGCVTRDFSMRNGSRTKRGDYPYMEYASFCFHVLWIITHIFEIIIQTANFPITYLKCFSWEHWKLSCTVVPTGDHPRSEFDNGDKGFMAICEDDSNKREVNHPLISPNRTRFHPTALTSNRLLRVPIF